MAVRNYSNNATLATTSAFIDSTTTNATLTNFAGFPVAPFLATIARGTVDEEIVLVTAVSGSAITMTRGVDGSTAKSHSAGSAFQHVATAQDFAEANLHVNASASVHGVTGALVGATSAQTLTNKTLVSPSVSGGQFTGTQSMAAATVTSLSVVGTATVPAATADSQAVNRGQAKAMIDSQALALDVAQVTPGTTRTTGTHVVAATGWRVDSYQVRCVGSGWLYLEAVFTRTGAAITVPTTGNITNQVVATVNGTLAPLMTSPLQSMASGRASFGCLTATPVLMLTAVGGTAGIATNDQLELAGYAKLADPGAALALLG